MAANDDPRGLVAGLFRTEAGRLVSLFARRLGPAHLDLAEEIVQDALVKALQRWPYAGVPRDPAAWLFQVARNGAIDLIRRRKLAAARAADLRVMGSDWASPRVATSRTAALDDDRLRMVLVCCHPALPHSARVVLSLKTVGGLSVDEIARALLSNRRAIEQRLVRAKRIIRTNRLTFDVPEGAALAHRIDAALDVVYLLFTEGHGASGGEHLTRSEFCHEALRLGRLIADAPALTTARACALVALMAFHAARLPARIDRNGNLVQLADQPRDRWDHALIARGFTYLARSIRGQEESAFHLQAAIAAAHASAPDAASTNWTQVLEFYDRLVEIDPSPVARLNRAVAVAEVHGAAAGVAALTPLLAEPSLSRYMLLPAVHADLLRRAGRTAEAKRAFTAALDRPCSAPERRFLESRLASVT